MAAKPHEVQQRIQQDFMKGVREGLRYQIGWIFKKVPKGGWGSFWIQRIILQILDLYKGLFLTYSEKNCNMIFRKWGGGGLKAVQNFSEKSIRFGTVTRPLRIGGGEGLKGLLFGQ